MADNSSWGIEVGANAIKALRLIQRGQSVVVDAYEVVPFKKILTTPGLDIDLAVREGLGRLLATHSLRRSKVVVSVPGNAAFAKFAKLPPVDPKKIPDIVKFEAVQQIPFQIEEVEWDYQVFMQPDSPDVEVGIFAITKDRVGRYLDNYQAAGMAVDGMTLSALAVYNAMAYDLEITADSPGVIFMDISTSSTDVIIAEGSNVWLRTVPIGGNHFTEALVRAFKLSFSKAEKLKREATTSKYARQIIQAMRPVFSDLAQEMQRTLGFYQTVNREAQIARLVGIGSSFRLPGMQKFLGGQLQLEVHRLDGFKQISVEGKRAADFAKHALGLVTAYGLALQGLGLDRVHANILPTRIVKQQVWRAKQPWFAAVAVLMIAACAAAWVRLNIDKNIFTSSINASQRRIDQTVNQANHFVQKWRQIEGGSDPRRRIENLRRILDYRDVWPKLMLDLTLALRTLNSQSDLMTSEYNAIKNIPRIQRRRAYIESLSAQYQFGNDHRGATERNSGLTIDDIWGDHTPRDVERDKQSLAIQPPAFLITLKGTTPHRDGPTLISQSMINWLKENNHRPDRPYRLVVGDTSLRLIRKLQDKDMAARRRSVNNAATANSSVVADVFPKRPLSDEPRNGDWIFEIQWSIELLRPEDARRAEDAG